MRNFTKTYRTIMENVILQGGNTFEKVDRIRKQDIWPTLDRFTREVLQKHCPSIELKDLFLFGSTGKNRTSGDIDVGVVLSALPYENIYKNMIQIYRAAQMAGYQSTLNIYNKFLVQVKFPQYPKNGKHVQIDLQIAKYPQFAKFYLHADEQGASKYKSAHRNTLLKALTKVISYGNQKHDKDGNLISWSQNQLFDQGYYSVVKTFVDRFGDKLKFNFSNRDLDEYQAKNIHLREITHDVDECVEMLFGEQYTQQDISNFQKVFDIIANYQNFKYADRKEQILKQAYRMFRHDDWLEMPEQLEKMFQ